jgi:hypothetical protein
MEDTIILIASSSEDFLKSEEPVNSFFIKSENSFITICIGARQWTLP